MKPAWVQAFSLLLALVATAVGGQEIEPGAEVVAVVDDDPILRSDLWRVAGLGLLERLEDEEEPAFQGRALDLLIDEKLRFHEIDRFGFTEISVADVDRAYEQIEARFAGPEDFAERLQALEVTPEELHQWLGRRVMVLTYVDERLGPRVFVSDEDVRAYYDAKLVPELEARGERPPELAEVRDEIRMALRQQRLEEELAAWTEELRLEAVIEVHSDGASAGPPAVPPGSSQD